LDTTAGSLTTLSSGAITAAGNLLLQAGGAGADLELGGNVSSTSGIATLKAADRIDLAANVTVSAATSLSLAAGAIAMDATASVSSSASLRLAASGELGLGQVSGVDVSLLAGGSIENGQVAASHLRMQAGGAIGSGAAPINLTVGTLAAVAGGTGAQGLYLSEADAVRIDAVSVTVSEFAGNGTTSNVTDAALADLTTGHAGNLVLVTVNGAITLADGNGDGRAVHAGGNLLLQAGGAVGDLLGAGDILSDGGHLTLIAGRGINLSGNVTTSGVGDIDLDALTGAVTFATSADVRAASGDIRVWSRQDITLGGVMHTATGNIALTSQLGNILDGDNSSGSDLEAFGLRMYAGGGIGIGGNANPVEIAVDSLSARTLNGDISLLELDGLTVASNGVAVTVLKVGHDGAVAPVSDVAQIGVIAGSGHVYLTSQTGEIVLNEIVDSQGDNVDLVGDLLNINQPLPASGGILTIHTSDPTRDIQIGDPTASDVLYLGPSDLANIPQGYQQIVIGSGDNGVDQIISMVGVLQPLVFHDPLLLDAGGPGSLIHLEGDLTAAALDARGPLEIAGDVDVTAGNIAIEQTLDGAAGAQFNQLNLDAQGGDIHLSGVVGGLVPLDGLVIDNAHDITFDQAVTLDGGDLVIHASGIVRFDAPLDLHGGHLTILGASQVILGGGNIGDSEIQAASIQVSGALHGGNLTLRGSDPAQDINLGGAAIAGDLNLSVASLFNLSGLAGVVIGERGVDGHTAAGAGNVHLAAVDLSGLGVALEVHGNAIDLAANPAGDLRLGNGIDLEALSNIQLNDSITTAAGDLHLSSLGGNLTMAAGSHLSGQGDAIELRAAGDLTLSGVDAQGATHGGRIVVQSLDGHILDADHDNAANLRANEVVMRGLGAQQGVAGENAVDVQASRVSIEAGGGVVFQDVSPDGHIHYLLMRDGQLYEQLINLGDAVRVTDTPDPSGDTFAGGVAEPLPPSAHGLFAGLGYRAGLIDYATSFDSPQTSAYLASYSGAVVLDNRSGLFSDQAYGLNTIAAATLGAPGLQLWSSGEAANDAENFDYWTESLAL
jgi:hypothetical protein